MQRLVKFIEANRRAVTIVAIALTPSILWAFGAYIDPLRDWLTPLACVLWLISIPIVIVLLRRL